MSSFIKIDWNVGKLIICVSLLRNTRNGPCQKKWRQQYVLRHCRLVSVCYIDSQDKHSPDIWRPKKEHKMLNWPLQILDWTCLVLLSLIMEELLMGDQTTIINPIFVLWALEIESFWWTGFKKRHWLIA